MIPGTDSPRRRIRILIVDDHTDSAESLRMYLKMLSHDVQVVRDGGQALAVALSWQPDFILLDLGLPGMDGYQVTARLRHEATCQEIVIIAVTGFGRREDREHSLAVGIDHHLVKPVELDELVSVLSRSERKADREGVWSLVAAELGTEAPR